MIFSRSFGPRSPNTQQTIGTKRFVAFFHSMPLSRKYFIQSISQIFWLLYILFPSQYTLTAAIATIAMKMNTCLLGSHQCWYPWFARANSKHISVLMLWCFNMFTWTLDTLPAHANGMHFITLVPIWAKGKHFAMLVAKLMLALSKWSKL